MNVLITYPSALEFWLNFRHTPSSYEYLKVNADHLVSFFETRSFSSPDFKMIAEGNCLSLPLHIMLPKKSQRRNWSNCVCHDAPSALPANSIIKISKNLFVISPELCFIIAARKLSLTQLAMLGYELCAKYRIVSTDPYEQKSIIPITTTGKLYSFIQNTSFIRGSSLARQAINYVLDNSNSPMESRLALLGRLPVCLGGYALKIPKLNHIVKLNSIAANYLGRDTCECDLVWPDLFLVVEYDSISFHIDRNQFQYDKKRTTALQMSGFRVLNITPGQVRSFSDLERLFFAMRRAMGLVTRKKQFDKYREKRWNVVQEVMFGRKMQ